MSKFESFIGNLFRCAVVIFLLWNPLSWGGRSVVKMLNDRLNPPAVVIPKPIGRDVPTFESIMRPKFPAPSENMSKSLSKGLLESVETK